MSGALQDFILRCFVDKKIIVIFFTVFGLLLISGSNAYADCSTTDSDCFTFDSIDGYVIGHGMRINVTDSTPGTNPTVLVMKTDATGSPLGPTVQLPMSFDSNRGVLYSSTYAMLTGSVTCDYTSCYPPNLNVAIGDHIKVQYQYTGGRTVVSTIQQIISDYPMISDWPYPSPGPQPDTTIIISCPSPTGRAGSSGDYICDSWKTSTGLDIPYTDSKGNSVDYKWTCTDDLLVASTNPDLDYPCPKINHKDIYVEVDWMQNHGPSKSAIQSVVNAYKNQGIFLHVQFSDKIPHKAIITGPNNGDEYTNYKSIKQIYFGTASDRTCPSGFGGDCSAYVSDILTAKRQVFHYALFAHQQSDNTFSSGKSEYAGSTPWGAGNDILVTLGAFSYGVGSPDQQAGTFMHELGHNLGVDHGGPYRVATDSSVNCKPNYLSLMSWTRQFSDLFGSSGRPVDYSVGKAQLAWLKFEGNTIDSSGTGHDGTGGSSSNYVTPGEIGSAFNFNGNTPITLANSDNALSFDVNTPFSISFWANVPTGGITQAFVTQVGVINGKGWYVWTWSGNNQLVFSINDGTNISQLQSIGTINDGKWHHYTVTYSGTGVGSIMQLYVDGVLNNWTTSRTSGSIQSNPPLAVVVGGSSIGSYRLNGKMDEVQMYNTALSSSQIQSLYNEKLWSFQKAWLKFEGNTIDSSGTGHDGTGGSSSNYDTTGGRIGSAFNFGGNTRVSLANSDNALSFNINNPFSISFWAKVPVSSGGIRQAFVTQVASINGKGWYVWMYEGTNRLYFNINDGTHISQIGSTGTINDGIWHHYTVTYSGTGVGSIMQLYVDGVLNSWTTTTTSGSIQSDPRLAVMVGGISTGSFPLNGEMDEMQMYNTTLSQSQVTLIYRQTTPGYDYTVNQSPMTENPITSILNQNTVFYDSAHSRISQPVRADTMVDWDLDTETSPDSSATISLAPSNSFTTAATGMNPIQVSISCPSTSATSFATWDDWHNLMFDITTTSSYADGAGGMIVIFQEYAVITTIVLYAAAAVAVSYYVKKWQNVRRSRIG